jgi:outer membrane receptor protein involved in Fe transport
MKTVHLILAFFLFVTNIYSQDKSTDIKTYTIKDSVVVIANRYTLPINKTANSLQVIPEQDIKYYSNFSAIELVDIFNPSAFVFDKRLVGYGLGTAGAGSLNIRGIGGQPNSSVLVLINGHPDFMGLFGHPLPDVYSPDQVKSVEIISGPSSTVFGSNAMGGVVNLVTGSDYDHILSVGLEGGSFSTFIGKIFFAKKLDKHGLFFSSRSISSDGHIPQTGFKSQNYQVGYDFFASPVWQLSIKGAYIPYSFDDPSRQGDTSKLGTYGIIKRGNGSIIASNNYDDLKGSIQLYGNMGYHKFYDGFYSHDFSYGASIYQQYKYTDQLSLALGSDYLYYGGKANSDNTLHKINSLGAYMLALYSPVSNLSFKGGIRIQYATLSLYNYSPVLGFTYNFLNNLELYGNYQSGFRFPTIQELYLFPISNPELKDETVSGYEFGMKYYLNTGSFIKLAVYSNKVENLIEVVSNPAPPPPVHFANSGSNNIRGVEGEARVTLTQNLSLNLGYGYLDAGSITSFNPKNQIKYMVSWQKDFYQVSLFGKYISTVYTADNFNSPVGSFNLLNLYTGFHIEEFTLSIKLNNLLDRVYYYLPGFRAPGFSILTGIDFTI